MVPMEKVSNHNCSRDENGNRRQNSEGVPLCGTETMFVWNQLFEGVIVAETVDGNPKPCPMMDSRPYKYGLKKNVAVLASTAKNFSAGGREVVPRRAEPLVGRNFTARLARDKWLEYAPGLSHREFGTREQQRRNKVGQRVPVEQCTSSYVNSPDDLVSAAI